MAAFLFVAINLRTSVWAENDQTQVPTILRKHGGAIVVASDRIRRYEGNGPDLDRAMPMTFSSIEAIDAFLADPESALSGGTSRGIL